MRRAQCICVLPAGLSGPSVGDVVGVLLPMHYRVTGYVFEGRSSDSTLDVEDLSASQHWNDHITNHIGVISLGEWCSCEKKKQSCTQNDASC